MEFSFPSTLKISKEYLLYKLRINSWHFHVWSFAIQWFYSCEKKLHVLKKNLSQLLKSHLQSSGSLTWAPVLPTSTWLSLPEARRDYHEQDARPRLRGTAKRDQALRSHRPSHRFQGLALLPDIQPWQPRKLVKLFTHSTPVTNVWSTAWLLQPAGFPGIWIKVKIENKKGKEKRQAETGKKKRTRYRKLARGCQEGGGVWWADTAI